MEGQNSKKKVVVLSGPTGVGKTKLSILLAERLGGEIISADSVQVYKGMDIGSNKVSREVQERLPHHLIDILQPSEQFTAGDFYLRAREITEEIFSRGKIPIIVGGTGLYLRCYLYGKPETPLGDEAVREAVKAELDADRNWEKYINELATFDSEYASSLAVNDWYRLSRALEIVRVSGRAVSSFPLQHRTLSPEALDYDFRCFFLMPDRHHLHRIIDARCDQMVDEGLVYETIALLRGGLDPGSTPARAIGYRQCIEFLAKFVACEGDAQRTACFLAFLDDFRTASRRYVKRQLTWFRSEELFKWVRVDVTAGDPAFDTLLDHVLGLYALTPAEFNSAEIAHQQRRIRDDSKLDTKGRPIAAPKRRKLTSPALPEGWTASRAAVEASAGAENPSPARALFEDKGAVLRHVRCIQDAVHELPDLHSCLVVLPNAAPADSTGDLSA